jgi:hypothetical protein
MYAGRMRCSEALGQRAQGAALYLRISKVLEEHSGRPPGPELRDLYKRLSN